ncbi:MAG: carbohydrate ABC transporter permease [Anaerolineae bacterium]|nr:carbohydrate ABC transporter permease [Anaerolineae bacterium]NPV09892.1 carbohydrate ABC transporter permease [Anaerolineae bacterium]
MIIARVVVLYALMAIFALTFLFPFIWMLSTSLKVPEQVWAIPPVWIPDPPVLQNYTDAIRSVPTIRYLRNTLIITLFPTAATLLASSCVAFAFSRLEWRGRNLWFSLLLSTMMLPGQVTMIPVFVGFHRLGWVNTFRPLLVPSLFGSAFYIFLLRQFFLSIPREMDEAATMDGAIPPVIWWKITLPLAGPALAAVAIFSFIGHWNDFMGPLIYLQRSVMWPLSLGLLGFRQQYLTKWEQIMAYSLMVMLPCLLVFFFSQRYFIQGITLSGLKG